MKIETKKKKLINYGYNAEVINNASEDRINEIWLNEYKNIRFAEENDIKL